MNTIGDEKLRNTRDRLVTRSEQLCDRIQRVRADLRRDRTTLPRVITDTATVLENDEILHALEASAGGELNQIERALERLEAGTFATCEVCNAAIDADRLAVVPYAVRCAACAQDA